MNVLNHFSIPYKGMGNGIHEIEFQVEDAFFKNFEDSHISNGSFKIEVILDKKFDHSVLDFSIDGYTKTGCDRCLEKIDLPVFGEYQLHIKHSEEGESNDEIMFIHPETSVVNLAQVVYEFILLSIPLINAYDCEEDEKPPCNFDVLDKLNQDVEEKNQDNPIWDSLNDLKFE